MVKMVNFMLGIFYHNKNFQKHRIVQHIYVYIYTYIYIHTHNIYLCVYIHTYV